MCCDICARKEKTPQTTKYRRFPLACRPAAGTKIPKMRVLAELWRTLLLGKPFFSQAESLTLTQINPNPNPNPDPSPDPDPPDPKTYRLDIFLNLSQVQWRPHHEHSSTRFARTVPRRYSKRCVLWHSRSCRKEKSPQTTDSRSFPLACRPATGRACGTKR